MSDIRQRSTRVAYRNPWLTLREDEIEYPDGSTGIYAVVDKQDFVTVLPWEDGGFWLVQQYRYPVGSRQWEFPQGGWGSGHTGTMHALAVEELSEETGFQAATWRHLGRLFAAYGYSSQCFDVFLATDLTPGAPRREVSEQDMVHQWFSERDVEAMVLDGTFADSHSLAALALCGLRRSTDASTQATE